MSSGPASTTSQTTTANPQVQQYISNTIPYLQQAQGMLPIGAFALPAVQGTAGLSPTQQWVSGQLPTFSAPDPNVQSAQSQLAQLTGGPIGSSPATAAGMQAFTDITQPSIQNQLSTMGLGRSGAGADILARAQTQAAVPLLQQEIANREQAVGQYAGLGSQEANRLATGLGLGVQQGGTEQRTAQSVLDNIYQDFLRRQQLSQNLSLPQGGLPISQLGQLQQTTSQGSGWLGK